MAVCALRLFHSLARPIAFSGSRKLAPVKISASDAQSRHAISRAGQDGLRGSAHLVLRNLIRANGFTTEETRRAFSSSVTCGFKGISPELTDLAMVNPSATNCPGTREF